MGDMVYVKEAQEKERMAKMEENRNDLDYEPGDESRDYSITELAKEALHSAEHKTKEIMHAAKEMLIGDDKEKEETEAEHVKDNFVQDENNDISAKREKATRHMFSTDQFKEMKLPEEPHFSETEKRHAAEAQQLAFVHAQQV